MRYTILAVDKEKFILSFIKNALELDTQNYNVITVENCSDALRKAKEEKVDVVIVDFDTYQYNDLNIIQKFKEDIDTNWIPIIAMTSTENFPKAFEEGAIDFLRKPIDKTELIIRVKSTLSMFKLINDIISQSDKLEIQSSELEKQKFEIEEARNKSEKLLLNILPYEIAEQLKYKGSVKAKNYRLASILFTDFVGFTRISESLTPQQIIKELSIYFGEFDQIIDNHFIEKIKTIGDAYMCVGGLPLRNKSNPIDTVLAALEMQQFMKNSNIERIKNNQTVWNLRIGIHTGRVVAGVIGKKKFAYDIWGDAVNTASRMESGGEPGKVNISDKTYQFIKDYFDCTYRGKIKVKNKGDIDMYFVNGLKEEYCKVNNNLLPNINFLKILSEY